MVQATGPRDSTQIGELLPVSTRIARGKDDVLTVEQHAAVQNVGAQIFAAEIGYCSLL